MFSRADMYIDRCTRTSKRHKKMEKYWRKWVEERSRQSSRNDDDDLQCHTEGRRRPFLRMKRRKRALVSSCFGFRYSEKYFHVPSASGIFFFPTSFSLHLLLALTLFCSTQVRRATFSGVDAMQHHHP